MNVTTWYYFSNATAPIVPAPWWVTLSDFIKWQIIPPALLGIVIVLFMKTWIDYYHGLESTVRNDE